MTLDNVEQAYYTLQTYEHLYYKTMDDDRLNKVKRFYYKNRRLPSFREMKLMFKLSSPASISWLVSKWVKQNILALEDKKITPAPQFFALPLLGSIKAGSPTMDETPETATLMFNDYALKKPGSVYLLRVSGDSMINAGIQQDDWVVLDRSRQPKTGDIVAANVDWHWTLKYFNKEANKVFLSAANPAYDPIYPKSSLEIGGVVVRVVRDYY